MYGLLKKLFNYLQILTGILSKLLFPSQVQHSLVNKDTAIKKWFVLLIFILKRELLLEGLMFFLNSLYEWSKI